MIQFKCPACGKKLAVPEEHAGRKARCPGCKQTLTIPAPAAEPPKQPAPPWPPQPSATATRKMETPRAEPDVADALRTRLGVPARQVKHELWIDKRTIIGLLGAFVLFAGAFTPVITSPSVILVGGIVVIGIALASIVLTLIGRYRSLLIAGLLALGYIAYRFIDFELKVSADIIKDAHISWGGIVPAAGVIILVVAGSMKG